MIAERCAWKLREIYDPGKAVAPPRIYPRPAGTA
ncbi:hypothetical protein RAS2_26380 [Phycisphaerae bacterium RAS2]|nr:hypothetical protein RAS2_26380 [Phycisphaerae bacterium RAS2]